MNKPPLVQRQHKLPGVVELVRGVTLREQTWKKGTPAGKCVVQGNDCQIAVNDKICACQKLLAFIHECGHTMIPSHLHLKNEEFLCDRMAIAVVMGFLVSDDLFDALLLCRKRNLVPPRMTPSQRLRKCVFGCDDN